MAATRHKEIADCLIEDILRGQYRTGERLPSERDLSARFQANRGAVREAVKKLEQLGLIVVQPGGARVCPLDESSLDVLGYMLRLDEYPDPDLIEQMMEVMAALTDVAVKRAIANASDEEIDQTRKKIAEVLKPGLRIEELLQARMDLWCQFMRMSGNLVLTLIGRSLRVQIMEESDFNKPKLLLNIDTSEQLTCLQLLDNSLANRDAEGAVSALQQLAEINSNLVLPLLIAARLNMSAQKVVASR